MSTAPPPPSRTVEVSWGPHAAPPLSSWASSKDKEPSPCPQVGSTGPGAAGSLGPPGHPLLPILAHLVPWKTPAPPAPSTEGWVPGAWPTSQLPGLIQSFRNEPHRQAPAGLCTHRHTRLHTAPFSCRAPQHSGHPPPSSCATSHPRPQYCLHVGGHITPPPLHYLSATLPLQSCSAHCPPTQALLWDSKGRTRVIKEGGVLNSTPVFTTDHVTSDLPSLKGRVTVCWGRFLRYQLPHFPLPSVTPSQVSQSRPLPSLCTQRSPGSSQRDPGLSPRQPTGSQSGLSRCQPASCPTHLP